ncbi:tRNA (N(6)-L-threonylcarbamoyladenosine(37)-C(2))-methylthiotransferase MtaB [methanotrophic endosymbiont of Bathymodiolus puteoserpentis (Logatchev)]|jgi:threonylcarbamoyladenosine tRNA methylthiotransferase MtaB|uniref:tRNA (N(6)-L-threonylcarbamoyladenosine(37)-C(2))- methylthiotransferase MtaB n=1 Tax=methanotrophic endosymbiont of Bathymodiolus puteoserpentis (Logatchev) TaxID=343235 RepID=UPI0013C9C21C|nr:tRNA (N(6)-L-threonylcarbamoyladenosine(37)-C(2))-methylthiotransferase MtaB [methanotrophic endosymbiont of Bathymodiolus puteoserpentis (Logatchev)]SHE23085.1 tRNA-t(6)A37 methylthiotransferase [methanotrophic endosymbiont of Bathymodiolus puteoserpentis (Logatchev)]
MLVHLRTLGCRLNEAELESWAQAFQKAGHKITREQNEAQLIIVNSCAVTQDAVRKSRQLIRRIHRDNPSAKIIASGCYVTLNTDEAAQLLGVDLIVSNQDKDRLVELAMQELDIPTMPAMSTEPGETSLFSRGRQRAFVKVQDGCRYRCTFCIVTVARGEEKSTTIEQIVQDINRLVEQGIKEVILTGVHLGGYGSDIGQNLAHLITDILEQTTIPRLRLGSLEPWDLPDNFFALFTNPRLMPHLHLPLQSGSDSVLKRMARRCKTEEFTQIIADARAQVPHINITTDIIVGFPGETEREWQDSFAYIKSIGFGHIHIFTYSMRTDTKAATLPEQVPNTIKKQRSQQLHKLAEKMKQDFFIQNQGHTFKILWEGQKEKINTQSHKVFGYTPNYLRVATIIENSQSLENQIFEAKITELSPEYLLTELV